MTTSIAESDIKYKNFCLKAATDENVFNTFRSNKYYNEILEHVSYESGTDYYNHITKTNNFKITSDIIKSLKEVDYHGSPRRYMYEDIGEISPTIIRYLSVITDIKKFYGSLNDKIIVEIGAGYGGQSLLINKLYKIKKYIIVDLPEVNELIKKYLIKNNVDISTYEFYTPENVPVIESDYLISNYAFSECYKNIQDIYLNNLINKTKNYYMIMNFAWGNQTYSLDEMITKLKPEVKVLPEVPLSHSIFVPHPHNVLLIK